MTSKLFKSWTDRFCSLTPHRLQRLLLLLSLLCVPKLSAAVVIDVRNYGAVANDSVDDSMAIQNAINAAPNNSTIYFPQGTYLVSGVTINGRTGLTLTGDGSTSTILKRDGAYAKIVESIGSTNIVVTQLGFDVNGITAFGGFNFYDAKQITIAKTRFFDSNKQPIGEYDRYAWVFGRGSIPSEDILIADNLIEDLQVEVDFGLRVRIEGNTVVRPVGTAGIGVFTVNDHTPAQNYTIRKNTIVDPVVSAGAIVMHLDPPSSSYSTMKTFRIVDNHIVYTKSVSAYHANAVRLGTGDNSQPTVGNVFDDIVIQNNVVYKDPGSPYDFGDVNAIIFGNSSATANFKFDNTNVSNNLIYYNGTSGIPNVDIRQKGTNYVESNNTRFAVTSDIMPPSVPTALTTNYVGSTEIHLAWNLSVDNLGVSRYRIYRNGVGTGFSGTPSYIDKKLIPGATYTYTVAAVDAAGNESSQSFAVSGTTTTTGVSHGRGNSKKKAKQSQITAR